MDAEDIKLVLILAFSLIIFLGIVYLILIYNRLRKYNEGKYRLFANLIFLIFILITMMMIPAITSPTTKADKMRCRGIIKQISLALKMYSQDYNGFYPPIGGAAGLEMLRNGGYLEDTRFYVCPNSGSNPAREGECLSENTLDYIYIGGCMSLDRKRTAIVYDKERNHKKYGNILYSDGHLEGFSGINWKENIINPPAVKKDNSD